MNCVSVVQVKIHTTTTMLYTHYQLHCDSVCFIILLFIYLQIFSREHLNIKYSPLFFYKAHSQNCEKLLLASSCLSVCLSLCSSSWNNSAPNGQIFMKFDFSSFWKSVHKIQVSWKSTGMKRISYEKRVFMIISHSILLRMRNVSHKSCRENQNTHFVFNRCFSKIVLFMMRSCGKILYSQTGHRWQYGARALHAGYLRL
jgi:hypothetical protein